MYGSFFFWLEQKARLSGAHHFTSATFCVLSMKLLLEVLYEITQCRLIGVIYNFLNANVVENELIANYPLRDSKQKLKGKSNVTFLAFSFANANRLILEIQPAEFSCSTSSVDPTIPSKS
ncbi:hypothetical protein BpHYR1_014744 [Brachionus plicatilis]|uniref:Uncharacterized protein n=1 Tax=Brachionus plicatilis TaxID=10195 RepID=A0A3M7S350_BRAPC|nr:hypothetical protein BpHYR1_014744 [Brachionus plicatilis]